MVAAKGDKEIGDRINKIIGRLADANDSLKGAINVADFNDEDKLGKGKDMVDRLTKLVPSSKGWISAATAPRATTCWATPTNT
jgi:type I restriction enzyme M protein